MIEDIKFHHIGIATANIDQTVAQYQNLGYEMDGEVIYDPEQDVNICFLKHDSMPLVELLSPVNNQSPIVQTLNKNGVTPYHTCYEVEKIEETIKLLRKLKYVIVSSPKHACAIGDKRVAFLYHKDMGLIEIVEA